MSVNRIQLFYIHKGKLIKYRFIYIGYVLVRLGKNIIRKDDFKTNYSVQKNPQEVSSCGFSYKKDLNS